MAEIENTNKLKSDIEKYITKEGWPGFFGLLATINPRIVDQEDLAKYNSTPIPSKEPPLPNMDDFRLSDVGQESNVDDEKDNFKIDTSIYAREHIQSVKEDFKNQQSETLTTGVSEQAKVRVLENKHVPFTTTETVVTPNPWESAEVVTPGQLKL